MNMVKKQIAWIAVQNCAEKLKIHEYIWKCTDNVGKLEVFVPQCKSVKEICKKCGNTENMQQKKKMQKECEKLRKL